MQFQALKYTPFQITLSVALSWPCFSCLCRTTLYQGAYFVSRQPNGTAVYHDVLPSAGTRFIDMAKFPQALGFGLPKVDRGANNRKAVAAKGDLDPGREGAESLGSPYSARFARVIRLDFLLGDVVGRIHRLDFEAFAANDKLQPLHVVVSVFVITLRRVGQLQMNAKNQKLSPFCSCHSTV